MIPGQDKLHFMPGGLPVTIKLTAIDEPSPDPEKVQLA